jgi:DUF438 domain-containing protein
MSELITNQTQRVQTLKRIIEQLHDGRALEDVKLALRTLVKETDHSEIIAMEQELMAEGMPASEIQRLCDLYSEVTREVLVCPPAKAIPSGHPIDTFLRENEAARGVLARMREAIPEVSDPEKAEPFLLQWRQTVADLMDIEKHSQRKEHLLFSCLERHGVAGPSKVMWGKDDEIRASLKRLSKLLYEAEQYRVRAKEVVEPGEEAIRGMEEMIYKEKNILFPLALDRLQEEEWDEIWVASPRYDWCLVEPREGFQPSETARSELAPARASSEIQFSTGNLSFDQLRAIFSTVPVDITLVDADDRVAFYSEGPDRVFARSKAVIRRKVQNCHPPRSVHIVERILKDFREGLQDIAEFWINFQGRFVHIRYFAVRRDDNCYLGTLEVTQDLTRLRALKGERRLLEFDDETAEEVHGR